MIYTEKLTFKIYPKHANVIMNTIKKELPKWAEETVRDNTPLYLSIEGKYFTLEFDDYCGDDWKFWLNTEVAPYTDRYMMECYREQYWEMRKKNVEYTGINPSFGDYNFPFDDVINYNLNNAFISEVWEMMNDALLAAEAEHPEWAERNKKQRYYINEDNYYLFEDED